MSGKVLQIAEYSQSEGIAVIGGYVYKGAAISRRPHWQDLEPDRVFRQ